MAICAWTWATEGYPTHANASFQSFPGHSTSWSHADPQPQLAGRPLRSAKSATDHPGTIQVAYSRLESGACAHARPRTVVVHRLAVDPASAVAIG